KSIFYYQQAGKNYLKCQNIFNYLNANIFHAGILLELGELSESESLLKMIIKKSEMKSCKGIDFAYQDFVFQSLSYLALINYFDNNLGNMEYYIEKGVNLKGSALNSVALYSFFARIKLFLDEFKDCSAFIMKMKVNLNLIMP